ncbi:unnamed protein product, partial [Iphiclides podalirius]
MSLRSGWLSMTKCVKLYEPFAPPPQQGGHIMGRAIRGGLQHKRPFTWHGLHVTRRAVQRQVNVTPRQASAANPAPRERSGLCYKSRDLRRDDRDYDEI